MEWVKQIKICLSGSFSLPIHDLFIREVNKKTGNKAIKHKAKNFFYAYKDFKLPLTFLSQFSIFIRPENLLFSDERTEAFEHWREMV